MVEPANHCLVHEQGISLIVLYMNVGFKKVFILKLMILFRSVMKLRTFLDELTGPAH